MRKSVLKEQSEHHCDTDMISVRHFGQCSIFLMVIFDMQFTPVVGIVNNAQVTNESAITDGKSQEDLLEQNVDFTTFNATPDMCEKLGEQTFISRSSCGTTNALINVTAVTGDLMSKTFDKNVSVSRGTDDLYFVYLPFGVISVAGNVLIIIIMSQSGNRGRSTSFLFIMLAISDTCLTVNNMYYCALLGTTVLGEERDWILGIITNLIWKINVHISNYLLVVITIERVISLAFPFKVKTICSKLHLSAVLFAIFAFVAVVNIPLWLRDWPSTTMENLETVDLIIGFFVPFVIILAGGIYIVIKVKYGLLARSKYNTSVTNSVLGTILAFIITMLPRRIIYLLPTGTSDEDKVNFLIMACQVLECLNTGVNFFVYILAGRKFREDFINLITRRQRKKTSKSNSKNDSDLAKKQIRRAESASVVREITA